MRLTLTLLTALLLAPLAALHAADDKPNILIILADDLGWSDDRGASRKQIPISCRQTQHTFPMQPLKVARNQNTSLYP